MLNKKYTIILLIGLFGLLLGNWVNQIISPTIKIAWIQTIINIFSNIISSVSIGLIVGYINAKIKIPEKISDQLSKKGIENLIYELISHDNVLTKYKKDNLHKLINLGLEYRTNTIYNAEAYISDNKVIVETTVNYTVHYLSKNKPKIEVRFDTDDSFVEYIKIINPENSNDYAQINLEQSKFDECKAHGTGLIYHKSCEIPKKFKKYNTLKIEKKFKFIGEDHWINYGIILEHITEGINFNLTLSPDLSIKETTIFENADLYSKCNTSKGININSTKVLSQYSGFLITISKVNK